MGEGTKIQWCDHTWNPWEGCTKVSPGCQFCYAENRNHRFGLDNWGKGKPRRRASVSSWRQPIKWNRVATNLCSCGRGTGPVCSFCGLWKRRPRVFCASLADWLDDEVPIQWLADLMKVVWLTPSLDWLLLTKRPENWFERIVAAQRSLDAAGDIDVGSWLGWWYAKEQVPPQNVWIGTSVEDQKRADERIPELLKIPARIHFLSAEPMLGPINFRPHICSIHWVIFGGESGHKARICDVDWIRDGIRQCHAVEAKPFVKQLGGNIMGREMDKWVTRIKDKKGGDMSEWPRELQIREFPE